MPFHNKIS